MSLKGFKHSNETRLKMSNSKKGKIFSDETRLKMSLSAKGKTKSDEHKAKIAASNIGKHSTLPRSEQDKLTISIKTTEGKNLKRITDSLDNGLNNINFYNAIDSEQEKLYYRNLIQVAIETNEIANSFYPIHFNENDELVFDSYKIASYCIDKNISDEKWEVLATKYKLFFTF